MTGFDLNKALTDVDERFIEEADIANAGTHIKKETRFAKKGGKRVFRVALIAACLVTLLAGTVAAANWVLNKDNRFLNLFGSSNTTEEFENAYIPIGIVSKGDVTVTLENIVGDKSCIFCEFSTDYELENCPEGWLNQYFPGVMVKATGEAFVTDEAAEKRSACFCRDGKLWILLQIAYYNSDVDLSDKKMHATVTTRRLSTKTVEEHVFEWTNDYKTTSETITLNKQIEDITLRSITFSLTKMEITFEFPIRPSWGYPQIKVDYIILDDGTYLFRNTEPGIAMRSGGGGIGVSEDGTACKWEMTCGLLGEFAEEGSNEATFVSFQKIATICINGTEIDIR